MFNGFAKSAPGFFHELMLEMNRDWFNANKERYQTEWVGPMTELLDEVRRGLAPAYRDVTLAAPRVMRIHRDVRFARDKTPYKTHIGGVIHVGNEAVAMSLHLGLDEEVVGAGIYAFTPAQLATWRRVVAGPGGVGLAKIVAALRTRGYAVSAPEATKKVPTGIAADHPRAELLTFKGCIVRAPAIPRGLPHKAAFAPWLIEHGRAMAPLVRWLRGNVG